MPFRVTRPRLLGAALVAVNLTAIAAVAASSGGEPAPAADAVPSIAPPTASPTTATPSSVVPPSAEPSTKPVAPSGRDLTRISAEASFDLPYAAKRAYQRAADAAADALPGCGLSWELLAGIGRVESDHGRFDGSVLGANGVSTPLIRGVALDGVGPVAAIRDTDRGRLDGDRVWDRAVGPLQFIPSTWDDWARDGDRNGGANPDDLDDAAAAAAAYLCAGGRSLAEEAGMSAAVFSYNHSDYYVDLVLAFAVGYRTGVFDIPAPPVEPTDEPTDAPTEAPGDKPTREPTKQPSPAPTRQPQPTKQPTRPPSQPQPTKPPRTPQQPSPTTPPAQPPPSTPPTAPTLALRPASGEWTACGLTWCLAGYALDLGPDSQLVARAASDLDDDGTIEANRAEFDGLVGRTVGIEVERGTNVVYTIEGQGYRNADGSFTN